MLLTQSSLPFICVSPLYCHAVQPLFKCRGKESSKGLQGLIVRHLLSHDCLWFHPIFWAGLIYGLFSSRLLVPIRHPQTRKTITVLRVAEQRGLTMLELHYKFWRETCKSVLLNTVLLWPGLLPYQGFQSQKYCRCVQHGQQSDWHKSWKNVESELKCMASFSAQLNSHPVWGWNKWIGPLCIGWMGMNYFPLCVGRDLFLVASILNWWKKNLSFTIAE